MDLTPYVAALRDDLAAAAAVGDEATARAGTALAAALEPAVRLAMMNALSDLAGEVSDTLDDRSVSLRLQGREVRVVVDHPAQHPAPSDEAPSFGGFFAGPASSPFVGAGPGASRQERPGAPSGPGAGGPDVGDISRMTLRLVDQIKGQAERAAAAQGVSLNSWVAQAVQGALRDAGRAGSWHDRRRRPGRDGEAGADTGADSAADTGADGDPGSAGGGVQGWVRG